MTTVRLGNYLFAVESNVLQRPLLHNTAAGIRNEAKRFGGQFHFSLFEGQLMANCWAITRGFQGQVEALSKHRNKNTSGGNILAVEMKWFEKNLFRKRLII